MIVGFGNAFTAIDLTGYINELLDYYNWPSEVKINVIY